MSSQAAVNRLFGLLSTAVVVAAACTSSGTTASEPSTSGGVSASQASASPSGAVVNGKIAFAMDEGSGAQIYTIEPDGTDLRKLTSVSGEALYPDWSSDGSRILFADDINEGTASNIAIMNADGSQMRDLTDTGYRDHPDFIPGGNSIVYGCDCEHNGLFISGEDGTDEQRLTRSPFLHQGDGGPAVSPDGGTVSFVRVKEGEVLQALFIVDVDGGRPRMIVPYSYEVPFKNDWAPDGNHIFFTIYGDSPGGLSPNVAAIRPDGTGMHILTHFSRAGVGALAGSYSPDGRWIAYRIENENSGTVKLMKMHPNGSGSTLIASLPASPRGIDWGRQP